MTFRLTMTVSGAKHNAASFNLLQQEKTSAIACSVCLCADSEYIMQRSFRQLWMSKAEEL